MKSLKTIQSLSKVGMILSKIAFIFSVIGFCGCVVGLIGLGFGGGNVLKIGGVTLHGLIAENLGGDGSVAAALSGWLFVCAGEAVLAKFSEICFKNELKAETPFTFAFSKEVLRLGILTLAIPTGCAVLGSVAEGIVAGFANVQKAAAMDIYFDNAASIVLGVMFIFVSFLCRYGAELAQNKDA